MNEIFLRRRRKVYVKEDLDQSSESHLATMQKNLESLGFICSQSLLERLRTLSIDRLGTFYKSLVKDLGELVGAHREFKPMYPNFPDQVMEISTARLYLNAIYHYFTNILPAFEKLPRSTLIGANELRVVELGSREEFECIFTQLAASRTSLSAQDKADVAWFISQYRDDIKRLLPPTIPMKENLAIIGAELLRNTSQGELLLADQVKTATDVLRVAVAMSDGDVSLAKPTKFSKFRRRDRRLLLSWLERCGDPTEDMLRWKERWKRLGERLHPGDYSDEFPKTSAAFRVLRENAPFLTFNGRVERALAGREVQPAVDLLINRPGDLTRRLDHLLRLGDANGVLDAFHQVAANVATPVLLQVLAHFMNRNRQQALRTFFPKGEVAKVQVIQNRLAPLSNEVIGMVATICRATLIARFAQRTQLGKCYLDPKLSNYIVPYSQRSASKSLRTLVRGSRLPLPNTEAVRFFLWWKNGSHRTDIDLSAVLYDAEYKYIDAVSYFNLKNFGGHHSGDIVDAPLGAAEFIDLDISRCVARNVRYVVVSLNSYTEQPYCDLPECFAGWMGRSQPNSGEIFEPRTVQDKIDVSSNTRICIPMILDFAAREVLWTDIALKKHPLWNNVINNLSGVSLILRALTRMAKPDLHTLFSLHIQGRGELVEDIASADCVFGVEHGVSPFDVDRITSEFL